MWFQCIIPTLLAFVLEATQKIKVLYATKIIDLFDKSIDIYFFKSKYALKFIYSYGIEIYLQIPYNLI